MNPFVRMMRNLAPCLLFVANISAQEPASYLPMKLWHVSDTRQESREVEWIGGRAKKTGGAQQARMTNFRISTHPYAIAVNPQAFNWIELRATNGSWKKVSCDMEIYFSGNTPPPGDWSSAWDAMFVPDGDYTGYKLFVNGGLFAEQYFLDNQEAPTFKVTELSPTRLQWSLRGGDSFQLEFNYDWPSDWVHIPTGTQNDEETTLDPENIQPYPQHPQFRPKATHPLLVRFIVFRNMQRYVGYYQMGKGYISGPKEAGAEDDFVPHPKKK